MVADPNVPASPVIVSGLTVVVVVDGTGDVAVVVTVVDAAF